VFCGGEMGRSPIQYNNCKLRGGGNGIAIHIPIAAGWQVAPFLPQEKNRHHCQNMRIANYAGGDIGILLPKHLTCNDGGATYGTAKRIVLARQIRTHQGHRRRGRRVDGYGRYGGICFLGYADWYMRRLGDVRPRFAHIVRSNADYNCSTRTSQQPYHQGQRNQNRVRIVGKPDKIYA